MSISKFTLLCLDQKIILVSVLMLILEEIALEIVLNVLIDVTYLAKYTQILHA